MERIYLAMEESGLDAYLICDTTNVSYVSGYSSDGAVLLIAPDRKFIITDPRFVEQAAKDCPEYTILETRKLPYMTTLDAVKATCMEQGFRKVGFESSHMTVEEHSRYAEHIPVEWIPLDGVIEEMRSVKTPQEIEYLRTSCEIACRAFDRIIKDIRVGVTEKELAARLSLYMVLEGADTQPYGNILISGPNSSLLHGIPSERSIQYGDLVLMDYGCQYHGYKSDMTRTVVVGKATSMQREVYDLVHQMIDAMEASMIAGANGDAVYKASAKPLEGSKYYPYHYNRVGHGIGRGVHEIPFTGPDFSDLLHEGTVMTAEPGIYIPRWGGIRIEDQLLIHEGGNEILTTAAKELIEL